MGLVCIAALAPDADEMSQSQQDKFPATGVFSQVEVADGRVWLRPSGTAWKSEPSWYIVANHDQTVHPDLQRFVAKRMGASTHAVDSSHVPMLSHPDMVLDVIRSAAKAVHAMTAVA